MFCWRVQLFYKWNALSLPEQFLRSTWFVFSLCRLNSCLCSSNKFDLFMSSGGPEAESSLGLFSKVGGIDPCQEFWPDSKELQVSHTVHCSCVEGGLPHLFSLSVDKSTTISYFVEVLSLRMLFLHHLRRFHTGQKIPQHLLTPGFYL